MAYEPPTLPPGTGAFRPADDEKFEPFDHMRGWSLAVQNALDNIGRSPGRYQVKVVLSATVRVENPGSVVEYIATLI